MPERRLLVGGRLAAPGARAFDVLLAVVGRRGRIVSKAEILEAAWPGMVVEENNLAVAQALYALADRTGGRATMPAARAAVDAALEVITAEPAALHHPEFADLARRTRGWLAARESQSSGATP